MTMNDFLDIFRGSLKHMPNDEKSEIVADYREHFEIGFEAGKTADEITAELGDPIQLAKMYSAHTAAETARQTKGIKDTFAMLGAVISYKIGGGLLIGIVYIVCAMVIVTLFGTAAVLITGGMGTAVLAIIELVHGFGAFALMSFFTALTLVCGGALFWQGNAKLWHSVFGRLPNMARRLTRKKEARYV